MDSLLEPCEITAPPENINWEDPDDPPYKLSKYSVELIADNKRCNRQIEAIKRDKENSLQIYKDAVK